MSQAQGDDTNAVALRAIVRGRVQGVGFRDFVWTRANALGLAGYVRNGSDGRTVEVEAEGDKATLEKLLKDLKHGPPMSIIESVDAHWSEAMGWHSLFNVQY